MYFHDWNQISRAIVKKKRDKKLINKKEKIVDYFELIYDD